MLLFPSRLREGLGEGEFAFEAALSPVPSRKREGRFAVASVHTLR